MEGGEYQSVNGLFALKVLVDVWGPKLFADVTVIQTFKGGGGQQFGGKKATHQHSGAEREKNVFLSMQLDNLNVDVGHLFCFGEQINEDLKPLRTNEITDYIVTASFIYCEHSTLSNIHSNIKNWLFE